MRAAVTFLSGRGCQHMGVVVPQDLLGQSAALTRLLGAFDFHPRFPAAYLTKRVYQRGSARQWSDSGEGGDGDGGAAGAGGVAGAASAAERGGGNAAAAQAGGAASAARRAVLCFSDLSSREAEQHFGAKCDALLAAHVMSGMASGGAGVAWQAAGGERQAAGGGRQLPLAASR